MFLNLGLIILESLLLALISLTLHARSRRYGLAPLLLYLAGLVTIRQTTSPLNLQVDLGNTFFLVASVTLVPTILMTVLVLYEVEGTGSARLAIIGIIGLSVLVLLVQVGLAIHMALPVGGKVTGLPSDSPLVSRSWFLTLGSTLAFAGSLLSVVIVHQLLSTRFPGIPSWILPGLSILSALLVDDVILKAVMQRFDLLTMGITGGTGWKLAGGLLVWPLAAAYLGRIAPKLEGYRGLADRTPLEVVFGTYGTQEAALETTIQERRRAEEELKASEIRFRTTFEQVGVGLAHIGLQGNFLLVNRALCEILGYTQEELLRLSWQDITPPQDLQDNLGQVRRLLAGEMDFYEGDRHYLGKNGRPVSCFAKASLVRDETGEPQYLVAAVEDMTERIVTEEHLRQAQKMEAVGQLTGGIAHDFNNLLTVIMGGIQLGLDGDGPEPLEEAFLAAKRGADLTQRLLAFSRKQSLRPGSLDPGTLLAGMEGLLTRTLGETVRIQLQLRDDAGRCLADPGQMENAILNLALNARDAMPRGGEILIGTRRIRVKKDGHPVPEATVGDYVQVFVVDSGTGIAPADMGKIFDPFFTTKGPGKGSGLGLSMVYGFARQSNGFVTVESEEGKGTAVTLSLPMSQAKRREPPDSPGSPSSL